MTRGDPSAGPHVKVSDVFNLGMGEITVILLLALIFLGPKKLPELASGLGRMIRQIRKTTADVKNEIVLDDAIRKPFEELRDAVTLHPDELKRRDAIQKSLEEARRNLEQLAANAPPTDPGENGDATPDPAAMAEGAELTPAPPPPVVAPPVIPPPPPSFRAPTPPPGTVARRPTPAPIPPPPTRLGPPRVTPPTSSLDGERANITQSLSEEDLLPPTTKPKGPPPLPPPLPGVPPAPPAQKKS